MYVALSITASVITGDMAAIIFRVITSRDHVDFAHAWVHNQTMRGIRTTPALIAGLLVASVLVCLVVATARAEERVPAGRFYDGLVAYNRGDFAKAAEVWHPLALAGDGNSQCGLGLLHLTGFGVRRDNDLARRLFLQAARQGVVQAQMYLSLIYLRGEGVRQDFRIAYMWSDIALAAGYGEAVDLRDSIAENLTPDEVREATKMAADWRSHRVDLD